MENKIQDDILAFLNDKEAISKLMKNDFINGHRPVQMYQDHHLQTIPKLNSEVNMENKVLLMLLEHNVEFDKEINNVDNINKIKERTRMQLFFIYSILSNYRNIDTADIPEIKRVAIDKLYYLYSNYIKLRLQHRFKVFLQMLEIHLVFKSSVENKLINYLTQATDLLLEGSIDVWNVSNPIEVDKIVSSCVDKIVSSYKDAVIKKKLKGV